MKKHLSCSLFIFYFLSLSAQSYTCEPTEKNPFGSLNPKASKEVADFAPYIGECSCKSVVRIDQNTWADSISSKWTFKYIMNGMAIQDETLKIDGKHSGGIRQFNVDSSKWYVHFYSSSVALPSLQTWEGQKRGDGSIVLYRDNPGPNGTPGFYRSTFSPPTNDGFLWSGAWVNKDETFSYPNWYISCKRIKKTNDK